MNGSVEDVLRVLERLLGTLEKEPETIENPTLPRYLESMRAWLEASQRKSPASPSWAFIAEMLEAASLYE